MKLHEVATSSTSVELQESKFKSAIAGGLLGVAASLMTPQPTTNMSPTYTGQVERPETVTASRQDTLTQQVLSKYKVSPDLAKQIVALAQQHEHDTFPKAEDILAIIGIESSFRPHAVSGLKKDPAVGLTQIRPGVWGLDRNQLRSDIEMQIEKGAYILHKYYKQMGNVADAVHVYNIGPGNFRRGKHNPKYVKKFKQERQLYAGNH